MNKLSIIIWHSLILGCVFLLTIEGSGQKSSNSTASNYIIAKYVIGSGGVMGASGTNYFHFATSGEPIVGFTQSANNFLLSGYWHIGVPGPTGVEQPEDTSIPETFELHQNYPNPFNPQTTIEYDLSEQSRVTVEILNLMGQRIRLLTNSQQQGPGFMQVIWDGCDDQGKLLGSGIYIYRVSVYATDRSDHKSQLRFQQSKKMLFVK